MNIFNIPPYNLFKKGEILFMEKIGDRIKTLRNEMKLTQEEFAEKIGVHVKQLSKYESNRNLPSVTILKNIADFCDITLDYLAYGKDPVIEKRSRIKDLSLVGILKKVDRLKSYKREKVKWAIEALLKESA